MNKSVGLRLVLCALDFGLGACASMKDRPTGPPEWIHPSRAGFLQSLFGRVLGGAVD